MPTRRSRKVRQGAAGRGVGSRGLGPGLHGAWRVRKGRGACRPGTRPPRADPGARARGHALGDAYARLERLQTGKIRQVSNRVSRCIRRMLEICRRTRGEEDDLTLKAMNGLAANLKGLNKLDDAATFDRADPGDPAEDERAGGSRDPHRDAQPGPRAHEPGKAEGRRAVTPGRRAG